MGAFDGNGNFVRSYNWVQDKTNNIDITASRQDTEDNGFAAGLTNCVTRDGQGKVAADFTPAADMGAQLGTNSLRWNGINGKSIDHMLPQAVFKAATTSRSALITPTADPDLILPVPVAGTYILDALLSVQAVSTSSQGFRIGILAQGTPTFNFTQTGMRAVWQDAISGVTGGTVPFVTNPASNFLSLSTVGPAALELIHITGCFIATSVVGAIVQIYWSQNTSSANATAVGAASYMTLRRID